MRFIAPLLPPPLPTPPPDTKRKRKGKQNQTSTNRTNVRKAPRLALFPKRGNRNAKWTEKHGLPPPQEEFCRPCFS